MGSYVYPTKQQMKSWPLRARIGATAAALPETIVSNRAIIERGGMAVSDRGIEKMTGVRSRRVAPDGLADSDLLLDAAMACLARGGFAPDQLSRIIVTKLLGDRVLPMTAAILQQKMRCDTAVQAYDIGGGAHSFFQALHTAACAVDAGDGPVLIVSGGVVNRLISRTDPRLAFLFGDGAAAVLVTPSEQAQVHATYAFSNWEYMDTETAFRMHDYASDALDPASGYEAFFDLYHREEGFPYLDFVCDALAVSVRHLLSSAGRTAADVGFWLLTENAGPLRDAVARRLGIPEEKTISLLGELGNTMSAMLPLALNAALDAGRIRAGDLVMLLSVGEGVQGGGMLITV